jgi:hypothetical protein
MEMFPKIKKEQPNLSQKEIIILAAKQWASAPQKKKDELEKAASSEKAKYQQSLETYEAGLALEDVSSKSLPSSDTNTSTQSTSSSTTSSGTSNVTKKKTIVKEDKKNTLPKSSSEVLVADTPRSPVSNIEEKKSTDEKKRKKEKKNKKDSDSDSSKKMKVD